MTYSEFAKRPNLAVEMLIKSFEKCHYSAELRFMNLTVMQYFRLVAGKYFLVISLYYSCRIRVFLLRFRTKDDLS